MDLGKSLEIRTKNAIERHNKCENYRKQYIKYKESIIKKKSRYIKIIRYITGAIKG